MSDSLADSVRSRGRRALGVLGAGHVAQSYIRVRLMSTAQHAVARPTTELSERSSRRTRPVRRNRYPAELARIQPVHQAGFAGVDDHVARPGVEVTDHWLAAGGTVEEPFTRILVARQGSPGTAFVRAHGFDDRGKAIHPDEHAETAWAAEQRMALEPAVRQGCGTGRARARPLAQQLQVFKSSRQVLLTSAVAAHEKPPAATGDSHRCAAVVAVRHSGIIGHLVAR